MKIEKNMQMKLRQKHLTFILNDLKKREEELSSDIAFLGALYKLKIENKNGKIQSIIYSAAENALKPYRKIIDE